MCIWDKPSAFILNIVTVRRIECLQKSTFFARPLRMPIKNDVQKGYFKMPVAFSNVNIQKLL